MFNRIKTYFRKHEFDLENPQIIQTVFLKEDGKPYTFNIYVCSACGKSHNLDLWQMKELPWSMARGCKGYKIDIKEGI